MTSRPHRFLQYLQELSRGERWHEVAALEGHGPGARQAIHAVAVDLPGRLVREIKMGIRLVLKWIVRALYLSPLLIILRHWLGGQAGDMVVVGFVLLVVLFFLLLNVYIIWSVVVHFSSRGRLGVRLPFNATGEDQTGVFGKRETPIEAKGGDLLRIRGTVKRVDELLPHSGLVFRDFWALEGTSPWRLTESVDFAVITEGEGPVIIQLKSAPLVIAKPQEKELSWAVHNATPGLNAVFDMGPSTEGTRASDPVHWLAVAEGDEVEIVAFERGVIDNVRHFTLGGRSCSLGIEDDPSQGPYRGTAGGPSGTLVVCTPETPVWLMKL